MGETSFEGSLPIPYGPKKEPHQPVACTPALPPWSKTLPSYPMPPGTSRCSSNGTLGPCPILPQLALGAVCAGLQHFSKLSVICDVTRSLALALPLLTQTPSPLQGVGKETPLSGWCKSRLAPESEALLTHPCPTPPVRMLGCHTCSSIRQAAFS